MTEEREPVSLERQRRVAHNEALYRAVNEQVEQLNDAFADLTGDFAIICECGDLQCMDEIRVPRKVYEHARASSHRFILKPGHQMDDVEDVIETHHDFLMVEKAPPTSRRVAEETDPRR